MEPTPEQAASFNRLTRMGLDPVAAEDQPYGVEIHTADGVFIKQMRIPKKGTIVPQHKHLWDHTTMLAVGSVLLWKDGVLSGRIDAPTGIHIKAGVAHAFQSLADHTVMYCVHGLHGSEAQAMLREHGLEGEV